jgi:hypothetical protein
MKTDRIRLSLSRRDAFRAARSLEARAQWLERRREMGPSVKGYHQAEASDSRRLAGIIRGNTK